MYGDFSRGHEPDRARGRHYRRVLLQQGRPVLDSDVAAEVDAVLEAVRATTRTLGCRFGSSDLGFLVTPGRLVTIFSRVRRDLRVTAGTPNVWVDFRFRYAGRYPALHLGASAGSVRVQVPATQPLRVDSSGTALTLWAHVDSATTITVNGVNVPLAPGGPGPAPYTFSVASTSLDPIELALDAGEVWLYLLEEHQPAGQLGTFAVAPGTFQVDGMVATAPGGTFPDLTYPAADGFGWDQSPPTLPLGGLTDTPAAGDRVVAYLEVWERVVTAVEDPGIREVALGTIDTSVRTQLMAQVKLAPLSAGVPEAGEAGIARAAFQAVEVSGGELFLTVPAGSTTPDPCALPASEGYSGDDNRLYRIQVHSGGVLSQVTFTWSRDNANELFAATLSSSQELVLDASTALAAGDLVEVLSSVVDLGDDQLGLVSAGAFVPPDRAVGQLGQLVEVPSQVGDDSVRFRLADVDDASVPVALDNRYGDLPAAGRSCAAGTGCSTRSDWRAGAWWTRRRRMSLKTGSLSRCRAVAPTGPASTGSTRPAPVSPRPSPGGARRTARSAGSPRWRCCGFRMLHLPGPTFRGSWWPGLTSASTTSASCRRTTSPSTATGSRPRATRCRRRWRSSTPGFRPRRSGRRSPARGSAGKTTGPWPSPTSVRAYG